VTRDKKKQDEQADGLTPESTSLDATEALDGADTTEAGGSVDEPEGEIEQARELSRAHLRGLLEALVFASDKPMKHMELARLASAPVKQVKELMSELAASYANRGILLDEVAGGWLFRTNAQYAPFVRELAGGRPVKLTRAQVETLAIAAYRQPVTRPEIDEIRGVDSGATLKLLLERDLVRILGKKDEPGRPLLYGTTTHFLEFFNMKSLKDLPTLREFTELSEESRQTAEADLDSMSAALPRGERGQTDVLRDAENPAEKDRKDREPASPSSEEDSLENDAPGTALDEES
jgi:segregation and condensation protein B